MFSIKKDADLLHECGYLKIDNNRIWLEFKEYEWNRMKNTQIIL